MAPLDTQRPSQLELYPHKLYNRVEGSDTLSNKKSLFFNLKEYYEKIGADPYQALPVTFHIKDGVHEHTFAEFRRYYERSIVEGVNVWIIKPGENSNRGYGIQVAKNFTDIKSIIQRGTVDSAKDHNNQLYRHSWIV